MKTTNPKVASKVLPRPDVDTESSPSDELAQEEAATNAAKGRRILAIAKRTRSLETIAEQIAQDNFYQRNHRWPGAKQAFPFNPKMQTVDKYFPHAIAGPLFVDEPQRKDDLAPFKLKQQAMKELGHRYLLLDPGMSLLEAQEALA